MTVQTITLGGIRVPYSASLWTHRPASAGSRGQGTECRLPTVERRRLLPVVIIEDDGETPKRVHTPVGHDRFLH